MKKVLGVVLAFALVWAVFGCNDSNDNAIASGYSIAMITGLGNIDDSSFNQGIWESIVEFSTTNNVTHRYYNPTEQTNDAYLAAIQLAVDNGAKAIVAPGFTFEEPVFIAQSLYPSVYFILIDGYPHNADFSEFTTLSNTVGIKFAEEQSGYLAGYAAVKDGYRKLGFIGGMEVPSVIRFGYGFVQGADAAAVELGMQVRAGSDVNELDSDTVDIKYHYAGSFQGTPAVRALAVAWYDEGVEVIFAGGGTIGNTVMSAAEYADAKVIGVDVDQSDLSPTVITSAMKGLSVSVQTALEKFHEGKFPGGESLVYAADKGGVKLPMDTSRFNQFTQDDYDKVFATLAANKVIIQNDEDVGAADQLNLTVVKVTIVD